MAIWDHVTGMEGVAKALPRASLPLLIHPEFWSRRRITFPGLDPAELPSTSRSALEGTGFEIVEDSPAIVPARRLGADHGQIDRATAFETGFRGHEALRDGRWEPDPVILDDQALVLRVPDRLVVLSGCGHAGIVNTVRYARRLTGEQKIAATIGGFHLSGPMFEPIIAPTVSAFEDLSPALLVPAHCTGWKAVHQLAARFPNAFVQSAVGTTIEL
jgi:7,8-dihydropterin-6-yl-methyl-4-(beta-D-ribofuranosyl)aminobenzene 5'-phosphate synthase